MFLNKEIKINRVMHVLVAILMSIFTSYGAEHKPKYVSIDRDLIPYVIQFDNMARARGVDIDWEYMDLNIRFANIRRSEILGVARGMHHATSVNIMINQNQWKRHTSNQKLWIMFHELAHDLFDIEHNEIELMMTRLPRFVSQSDLNRVMWELVEYLKDNKKWQENLNSKERKQITQIGAVSEKVQGVLKRNISKT
jgi:hypothetical protein